MRKTSFALLIAACVLTSLLSALAASAKIHPVKSGEPSAQKQGPQLPPEEIIRQFTKKESELLEVWKEYSYVQESKIQSLGPADTITGEFYQVSNSSSTTRVTAWNALSKLRRQLFMKSA